MNLAKEFNWKLSIFRTTICSVLLLGSLAIFSENVAAAEALNNGGSISGSIGTPGDEDTYEFDGLTGQTATLTMVDLNGADPNLPGNIYPRIYLYDPNGVLMTSGFDSDVGTISNQTLPLNGTYTVVAKDYYDNATGPYDIHLAVSPGADEHGLLVDGGSVQETITLGDLDTYTFDGSTGEHVSLTLVDLNGSDPNSPGNIYPRIYLYDPNGTLITSGFDSDVGSIVDRVLPLNGTYTVLAKDYYDNAAGPYEIHFARVPGAQEHGGLINGGKVREDITLGDMDTYTFYGRTGETVSLTMVDLNGDDPNTAGNLYPRVYLYDPNGALVTTSFDSDVGSINNQVLPLNGTYTVLAKDYYDNAFGAYEIHFAQTPGALEHGDLLNGRTARQLITLGDIDTYTFFAKNGDTVSITMNDLNGSDPNLPGNIYPRIFLYDPNGHLVTSASGSATASINNRPLTLNGTYTLVAKDYYDNAFGLYSIDFSSTNSSPPPVATLIAPQGSGMARRPMIEWEPSEYARSYIVYMRDASNTPIYREVFRAKNLGCAGGANTCSMVLPFNVGANTRWWIRSLNDFGAASNWSVPKVFSTTAGPAARATALTPSGTISERTPVYEWSRIANATRYRLYVVDVTGVRVREWVTPAEAGCVQSGQTCQYRFNASVKGSARWYVRSYNSDGFALWSPRKNFVVQ
ncbi:MAG: hypothetical protein AB8B97_00985 [Granulosicoccus sp.]